MKKEIKVMSFNLRMDTDWDKENRFSKRTDLVKKAIEREDPDLIGFQEVLPSMREWLRANMEGYTVIGCGRERDLSGESMTMAIRNDAFELTGFETKWLSGTPDIPGSTYGGDQSGCPRTFSSAKLWHRGSGRFIRFVNTHLDHEGRIARYRSAMQLIEALEGYGLPFVLVGDFNASPDSPEIELIKSAVINSKPVRECTEGVEPTYHDYGRLPPEKSARIDYIFTDTDFQEGRIVPDLHEGGRYYSDHFAVAATILPE